jgi:hypothetical protein
MLLARRCVQWRSAAAQAAFDGIRSHPVAAARAANRALGCGARGAPVGSARRPCLGQFFGQIGLWRLQDKREQLLFT